ncbi:MAG: B12-binding domain-containing radical SAM protein [Promethearchaeota archaeon]
MKILLIHTNQYDFGPLPPAVESQRGLNPPISLAYVAASALKEGFSVRILDMDAEHVSQTQLLRYICNYRPDVVGFSVMLNNFKVILYLSKKIKELNPEIKIIYGGIQVNTYPKYTISFPYVDIGVIGEGEFTFPNILKHLENNEDLGDIEGIVFKKNNKIITTKRSPPIKDIDQIPFPARELLPIKKYSSLIATRTPITIQFTMRGCPFHCSFCSKPDFWNRWRFHSVNYVLDEFERCRDLGIKEILVYDDTFTSNKKRVKQICKGIIERGIDITWDIRTRVDMVDEESLRWLKAANCQRISYGVESGDPAMLKRYNKGTNIKKIKNAFRLTKKVGMDTLGYFMIGGPNETYKSIWKTLKLMKDLDPDYVHITSVIPYPKTKLFDMAVEMGVAKEDDWKNLSKISYDSYPMFTSELLSREQIYEIVNWSYKIFYYRPKYILRQLAKIKSFDKLWRFFKAAISIIR